MKLLMLFSCIFLSFLYELPGKNDARSPGKSCDKKLQKELLAMAAKDQKLRKKIDITNISEAEIKKLGQVDQNHNKKLKKALETYSWPSYELIGRKGLKALWLLIQHQDQDLELQKKYLALFKEVADKHHDFYPCYAYLLDRVRMHENFPQVYGTQWLFKDGDLSMYQVEDFENLDKRRIEAGLGFIDQYEKQLKEFYHIK